MCTLRVFTAYSTVLKPVDVPDTKSRNCSHTLLLRAPAHPPTAYKYVFALGGLFSAGGLQLIMYLCMKDLFLTGLRDWLSLFSLDLQLIRTTAYGFLQTTSVLSQLFWLPLRT